MDHEIEDHVDIEGAGGKDAKAVGLEEHGLIEVRQEGLHSRIESLEMADLNDEVSGGGLSNELIGFGDGAGDGLFDQDMQAGLECRGADVGMETGGRADGDGLQWEGAGAVIGETGFQAVVKPRCCWQRCEPALECGGVGGVGQKRVNDGSEVDGMTVLFELLVDADVVLAEGAGTDDGDLKSGGQGQSLLALHGGEAAGVELEQVGDLIVRLGSGWRRKSSGSAACLATDAGGGGYKFEQVEGDVFIATGGGADGCAGDFHGFSSPAMLSGVLAARADVVRAAVFLPLVV